MKEYVIMYTWNRPTPTQEELYNRKSEMLNLVSEVFDNKEDAEEFAEVFSHNYDCTAFTRACSETEYVVFCGDVYCYRICVNFREELGGFLFATWKYARIGQLAEDENMGKYCENCGAELLENMKFCGNCGAEVPTSKPGRRCPKCNSANVSIQPKEYKPKLTVPLMMAFGGFGLMFLGLVGLVAGALIGLIIGAIVNGLTPQTYQSVLTCQDCGYSGVLKGAAASKPSGAAEELKQTK